MSALLRGGALLALALVASACERAPATLLLEVRTDLLPAVEFDRVRTEVLDGSMAGRMLEEDAEAGGDYATGLRVAEVAGIEESAVTVRVSLMLGDRSMLSRPLRVELLEPTFAATVLLASACANVTCEEGQACLAGRCVDSGCSETAPELCVPECEAAADCDGASACTTVECTASGTCFAAPDHASCGVDGYCDGGVGCVGLTHDFGAGLEANLVETAGPSTPATQANEGGWSFLYVNRREFGALGPLTGVPADVSQWIPMELARFDGSDAGWLAENLSVGPPGRLGYVILNDWDDGDVASGGDTLEISPENSVIPVVLWRAPIACEAELGIDVRVREDVPPDVEVHIVAVRDDTVADLDFAYLSGAIDMDETEPFDANGVVTTLATRAEPYRFDATTSLAAGDGLGVLVRMGDDDALDIAYLRGAIRIRPSSP